LFFEYLYEECKKYQLEHDFDVKRFKEVVYMSEETSDVSLSEIYNEVKLLREEAEKQYKENTKRYRSNRYAWGYALGAAVTLVGISLWVTVLVSPTWQKIDASCLIVLGAAFIAYCIYRQRKLGK